MSERWSDELAGLRYPEDYEQPTVIGTDPNYGVVREGDSTHLCCLLEDREDEFPF
jgi:hypothetical protein